MSTAYAYYDKPQGFDLGLFIHDFIGLMEVSRTGKPSRQKPYGYRRVREARSEYTKSATDVGLEGFRDMGFVLAAGVVVCAIFGPGMRAAAHTAEPPRIEHRIPPAGSLHVRLPAEAGQTTSVVRAYPLTPERPADIPLRGRLPDDDKPQTDAFILRD